MASYDAGNAWVINGNTDTGTAIAVGFPVFVRYVAVAGAGARVPSGGVCAVSGN